MICKKYPYAFQRSARPEAKDWWNILKVVRIISGNDSPGERLLVHGSQLQTSSVELPLNQDCTWVVGNDYHMKFYETLDDLYTDNFKWLL